MSIVPTFTSTCDLAQRLPAMVASFLDFDSRTGRRFREETVNDIIVASLRNTAEKDILVVLPNEAQTGSDFDILILNEQLTDATQYRIQAKRLTLHHSDWGMGTYRELCHPQNTGVQAATLVKSAAHEKVPTIPLYAFYNPQSVCTASGSKIDGVEMASGRAVAQLVKTMVKYKPKRLPYKRIGYLCSLFFPLSSIFCATAPHGQSGEAIISPRASREAVRREIDARSASYAEFAVPPVEAQAKPPPRLADELQFIGRAGETPTSRAPSTRGDEVKRKADDSILPTVIRELILRHRDQRLIHANVKRSKVVLFSSS